MIEPREALKKVLEATEPLETEKIRTQNAAGRILGRDAVSRISSPPFDKAAMDGFAVKREDTENPPTRLKIVGEVSAGQSPDLLVESGECARISTGAPMPDGTNDVVMVENTKEIGKNEVEVQKPPSGNVCVEGEDLKKGEVVAKKGRKLTPLRIGVAASAGLEKLPVHKKPSASLLCTGSELREPGEEIKAGQIYNANAPMLSSLLSPRVSELNYLGTATDDVDELRDKIRSDLDRNLLIISGGVSVGEHDLVPEVLKDLGVEEVFHKWSVKPGKPTFFGIRGKTKVFAMPGNPQSCFVVFKILVEPTIAKMCGARELPPNYETGKMGESFVDKSKREHFIPCRIENENGGDIIKRAPYHGSADIEGPSSADGFMKIPPEVKQVKKGEPMQFFVT